MFHHPRYPDLGNLELLRTRWKKPFDKSCAGTEREPDRWHAAIHTIPNLSHTRLAWMIPTSGRSVSIAAKVASLQIECMDMASAARRGVASRTGRPDSVFPQPKRTVPSGGVYVVRILKE